MNPPQNILISRRHAAVWLGTAVLCGLASIPAWAETVKGNGRRIAQARTASGFTGVALALPGQVELRIGATEAVTVEADENLMPLIETRVKDGLLQIRPVRNGLDLQSPDIKFIVQARQIDRLQIGGSGSIMADALRSARLQLEIGGSGSIAVNKAESEQVEVSIGGSGAVKITGVTRKLVVAIGGSGDVGAGGLQAEDVNVSVGGSGGATVWARQALSVSLAGSGDVSYYGDPKVKQAVVGSGRARRIGASPR